MLDIMLDGRMVFLLMGILTGIGIVSKCIVNIALRRLVRAAGNMSKSTHPLMRLVRAKFEHASMVSDKVENVKVFVDKYLYEYRVLGVRLHGWRRMEKGAAALCLLAGAAGVWLEYSRNGMSDAVWKTGAAGGGLAAFIYLVHLSTDEKYQMEAVQNYMVDFLENVCRHRFEKSFQKEIKVLAQEGAAEFGAMPDEGQEDVDEVYADEVYAVRKREHPQSQSAVSAFLAAELRAGEESFGSRRLEPEEAVDAFRAAEVESKEVRGAFRAAEAGQKDVRQKENRQKETGVELEAPGRRDGWKENILEIPVPDTAADTAASVVLEVSEAANASRASSQRQRMSRREKAEEETERDIVIRRILEEFMA